MSLAVCAVAAATLALLPVGAPPTSTIDPSYLRSILPDPLQSGWIEATAGQPGYIDGLVDLNTMRAYYEYYHQTEAWIDAQLNPLQQNGFVTGYERQWYQQGQKETLTEAVTVFAKPSGAESILAQGASRAASHPSFEGSFDPGFGPGAYGLLEGSGQVHFVEVWFAKGDATYGAGIAAYRALTPTDILDQARKLYASVPPNIQIQAPALPLHATAAHTTWMIVIAGLWLTVGAGVFSPLIAALIVVLRTQREQKQLSPAPSKVANP